MKNKKLFAVMVLLFCILLVSESYVQGFTVSGDRLSNAGKSASNWMKENIFLWYTMDTTGTLKPEYATQRKVVDFIMFFIMFFSLSLLGLKKAFGEGGGNAVTALAFSIGFLLALALVAFSQMTLAIFFPFAKNIIFLVMIWVIFAILKKIFGDKHTFWLFLLALIVGWLAFNYVGPGLGVSDMGLPRKDYTAEINDLESKMTTLESKAGRSVQEERELIALKKKLSDRYVSQGMTSLELRDYDSAQANFETALRINPDNNKARSWLEDGMFNRILKENIELLRVSKTILESMNKRYKETSDPVKKGDLCKKMTEMLTEINEVRKTLNEELPKRLDEVERERERQGIFECQKNYDCRDFKQDWVCENNKCIQCTQSTTPDVCGSGRVCDPITGKCKAAPRTTPPSGGGGGSSGGGWKWPWSK